MQKILEVMLTTDWSEQHPVLREAAMLITEKTASNSALCSMYLARKAVLGDTRWEIRPFKQGQVVCDSFVLVEKSPGMEEAMGLRDPGPTLYGMKVETIVALVPVDTTQHNVELLVGTLFPVQAPPMVVGYRSYVPASKVRPVEIPSVLNSDSGSHTACGRCVTLPLAAVLCQLLHVKDEPQEQFLPCMKTM